MSSICGSNSDGNSPTTPLSSQNKPVRMYVLETMSLLIEYLDNSVPRA